MNHKLKAVNSMLGYIGESPVSSLENVSGNLDVALAISILEAKNETVQEEGWYFNTEERTLSPDVDGFIFLPEDIYRITSAGCNYYDRITERDDKLYNKDLNTFHFTYPVEVEMVLRLDFNSIPAAARRYIELSATLEFITSTAGDSAQYRHIRQALDVAKSNLEQANDEDIDNNVLQTNSQFRRRYNI